MIDVSFWAQKAAEAVQQAAHAILEATTAPHVLMRPTVVPDGNKWSALYGSNLMEGVCGFGDTPEEAVRDFDKNWREQRLVPGEVLK